MRTLIAHGNLKFRVTRYGEVTAQSEETPGKSKPARRKSSLLVIKNFTQDDEYCEINPYTTKSKVNETQKRKTIEPTLTNITSDKSRVDNSMILNYPYQMLMNLHTSEWIPAKLYQNSPNKSKRRLSYNPMKEASDNNINIPPFRANIGAISSTTGPNCWSMNKPFYIIPLLKPTVLYDSIASTTLVRSRSYGLHESQISNKNEHFGTTISSNALLCTVDDLQLAPVSD
jgi:hypothetical protein